MNRPERYFRGRLAVFLTGGALVAALFPMAGVALASINTVVIGVQAPNPVTAGSTATYSVTSTTDATSRDTRITAVSGLPAGATFTSDCVVSNSSASTHNTLSIATTGSTPPATSTITPTVTATDVNTTCGTGAANATDATHTAALVVVAGSFSKLQVLVPGETAAPGTATGKTGTPTAQTVGTAFNITVNAVDPNWNVVSSIHNVGITSSSAGATLPANADLVAGTLTFSVTLNSAGSQTVTATDLTDGTKTPNTSSAITANAGTFTKLQVLVPGETAAPGTATGKTGTPSPQAAGSAFTVTVNAVDAHWNVVTSSDTVAITSSDGAANLPSNGALATGTRTFSITLNTLGSRTVTATDATDGAKTANTSAAIIVNGAVAKLQLLVPGETAAPGTTTGMTGTPTAQTAGTPFIVTVNAVDANWNVVSSTHTVGITSTDAAATVPANAALVAGTRTFSVILNTVGSWTVTATDITDGTKTANTSPAITVALGTAVKLGFTSQPGSSSINVPFTIQPVVAIQDAGGNTLTTAAATTVTLALGANPGAGTLTCTGGNTRTTSLGVAAFSGCTISNAGVGYTLVASATGYTSATSTAFTVGATGATITLTTSAPTPPGAQNPVITWGQGFTLGVQFASNGTGKTVALQGTRDGITWTTITNLTMGSSGSTTYYYTPVTNLWYRAVFAGTSDLAAATSNQVRTVVREIALLRPTNSGNTRFISRNTSITFTTTVRPARPELAPAKVSFWYYHQVNGSWVLAAKRDVFIDATGVARNAFTFTSLGEWYVRMAANPTPYNANSVMSPVERYSVN
jgi:hypothetical protein